MFTVAQIKQAHARVKSGADFPAYIREIKTFGVKSYTTWVTDGHTDYLGAGNYETTSAPKYDALSISDSTNKKQFVDDLKAHQQGQSDYLTFCGYSAKHGIEKWVVDLDALTCTYFDKAGDEVLVESIPV